MIVVYLEKKKRKNSHGWTPILLINKMINLDFGELMDNVGFDY